MSKKSGQEKMLEKNKTIPLVAAIKLVEKSEIVI